MRRRANAVAASSPTARSAAAFSPEQSRRRTISGRTIFAVRSPRFTGENFGKNLELVERVDELADAKAARRRRSRSRGCSHRVTTSYRFRAPNASSFWKRTSALRDIQLTRDELGELDAIFPPGAASGDRYADMSFVNR